jgi:hypothetical protein
MGKDLRKAKLHGLSGKLPMKTKDKLTLLTMPYHQMLPTTLL